MVKYQIEVTEEAKIDLHSYTVFEQKIIIAAIRAQLSHQPTTETKNRKGLRDNPIARWAFRAGKYRILYEVDKKDQKIVVVAIGHKEHNKLFIAGKEVKI